MKRYIMALDAGTTSVRCILFDREGAICGVGQKETPQIYPQPGWVEQDAEANWEAQYAVCKEALEEAGAVIDDVAALGITNQRETVVLWDRETGKPIAHAIGWQCRRTTEMTEEMRAKHPGIDALVREKTGLTFDPYFSGTKVKWLLDHVSGARDAANEGRLQFGTIDSWLIYKLTGGKVHVTDHSNASRTMLFNIHTLQWDKELCELLEIPMSILPEVKASSAVYGETDPALFGAAVPIGGAAGDQQAALFGQTCFAEGEAKNTYGTGGFIMMNTGTRPVTSEHGLLTTIAWGLGDTVTYALEGSIYVAGAALQWLRDEVQLFEHVAVTEESAERVADTNDCYVVPGFAGLGAPYWEPRARGTIVGLSLGTNRDHIIRATLESMAFQTCDVLTAMEKDSGRTLAALKVDGGASRNNFLLQFQADLIDTPCVRPQCVETTAMGAAYLAGLAVGFFKDTEEIKDIWKTDRIFEPQMDADARAARLAGWAHAVDTALYYARHL